MTNILELSARKRNDLGKGAAKRMRREGKIPGLFYQSGDQPVYLSFDLKEVQTLLSLRPALIKLSLDKGDDRECLIREVQRHPVSHTPTHLDLLGITHGVRIEVSVPISLIGIPEGVRDASGILQQVMNTVAIRCLPKNIPQAIEIDVSELSVGDSLHLEEVEQEGVELVDVPGRTVATVVPPTVLKEPEPVELEEEALEEGEEAEAAEEAEEAGEASEEAGGKE